MSYDSIFIPGARLRTDGAAPDARRIWPTAGTGGSTAPSKGVHLAREPDLLCGGEG
jgi:citronellol/citronellal dehydrogenase